MKEGQYYSVEGRTGIKLYTMSKLSREYEVERTRRIHNEKNSSFLFLESGSKEKMVSGIKK